MDIAKSPDLIETDHRMSDCMIDAMELDCEWIAKNVLKKFKYRGRIVPFLKSFIDFLSTIKKYRDWWYVPSLAEALRDLILRNPFLKPSMARANLLSGIHTGCRSYDQFDPNVLLNNILKTNTAAWTNEVSNLTNPVLKGVLLYKNKGVSPEAEGTIEANENEDTFYYSEALLHLVEYLRNLPQHGSSYSVERVDRGQPRKQLMQSLDETELAGLFILNNMS